VVGNMTSCNGRKAMDGCETCSRKMVTTEDRIIPKHSNTESASNEPYACGMVRASHSNTKDGVHACTIRRTKRKRTRNMPFVDLKYKKVDSSSVDPPLPQGWLILLQRTAPCPD